MLDLMRPRYLDCIDAIAPYVHCVTQHKRECGPKLFCRRAELACTRLR